MAPVRGLVSNRNLAKPLPESAQVMRNWFPTLQGARVRGGSLLHATIGSGDVTAMFDYQSGASEIVFAASATAIYNVTAPADPAVAPTAEVSGLSGGYWSFIQFETSGGDFLIGVNGADTPREYDGSTWSSSTMTGSGLTTSNLSHIWSFKQRLFFIEDGTMSFWYLPVGAKTGTLTEFSMQGVFQRGGSLLMGGTWSLDAGDGLDDMCVVISTLGEVAIFQGTDPSVAANWSIVGTYEIAEPLGKNAWMRAGGDFLVATVEGIVPISQAVNKDPAALSLSAITSNIEPDWLDAVNERQNLPWDLVRWDKNNLAVVMCPSPTAAVDDVGYAVNIETGAWSEITGWDMHCGVVVNGVLYFGNGSGQIMQGDAGGSDNGEIYTCSYVGPFVSAGGQGPLKVTTLARAYFRSTKGFTPQLSVSTDYQVVLPVAPGSTGDESVDEWDSGLWDTAVWDSSLASNVTTNWVSVTGRGDSFAPQVQISFGVNFKPDVELIKFQLEGYSGRRVA